MRKSEPTAQSPAPKPKGIIKHVIQLEKLVWKVAQERDAQAFAQLVPADAIMIFQSGVTTQPQYISTMSTRTISRYKLTNVRGFMPTSSTVILLYEAVRIGRERNKNFPTGTVIESTTWVKRRRKWVAILNQETPLRK